MDDDEFVRSLERLVADSVAEARARERSQARVLREVAEQEATFAGVALDLAERGAVVVARTAAGRPHRGRVLAVGKDLLVLGDGAGPPVLLALPWLASLRPQADASAGVAGARTSPLPVSLAVLLSSLAVERPRVLMMAAGDEQPWAGELRSVGADVATLRLDGADRSVVHLRVAALAEVVLLDR